MMLGLPTLWVLSTSSCAKPYSKLAPFRNVEVRYPGYLVLFTLAPHSTPSLSRRADYPLCDGTPSVIGTGLCTTCKSCFGVSFFLISLVASLYDANASVSLYRNSTLLSFRS